MPKDSPIPNMRDKEKLKRLMRTLGSHGTNSDCYVVAIAMNAAWHLYISNPSEFDRLFGTIGSDMLAEYMLPGKDKPK